MRAVFTLCVLVFLVVWLVLSAWVVVRAVRLARGLGRRKRTTSRHTEHADLRLHTLAVAGRVAVVGVAAGSSFVVALRTGIDQELVWQFVQSTLGVPIAVLAWTLMRVLFLAFVNVGREQILSVVLCWAVRALVVLWLRLVQGVVYVLDEITVATVIGAVPIAAGFASILGHLDLVALPQNEPLTRIWLLFVPVPLAALLGGRLALRFRRYLEERIPVPEPKPRRSVAATVVPRQLSTGRLAVAAGAFFSGMGLVLLQAFPQESVSIVPASLLYTVTSIVVVVVWSLSRSLLLRASVSAAGAATTARSAGHTGPAVVLPPVRRAALFLDEVTLARVLGYPGLGAAAAYFLQAGLGGMRLADSEEARLLTALLLPPIALCLIGLTFAGIVRHTLGAHAGMEHELTPS